MLHVSVLACTIATAMVSGYNLGTVYELLQVYLPCGVVVKLDMPRSIFQAFFAVSIKPSFKSMAGKVTHCAKGVYLSYFSETNCFPQSWLQQGYRVEVAFVANPQSKKSPLLLYLLPYLTVFHHSTFCRLSKSWICNIREINPRGCLCPRQHSDALMDSFVLAT